mmetsp:Transcript_18426/g.30488  ORF Transcript_18426/g.30488 Transcript_18426/m.30488 type:complete len:403 (-) Transcript_18426:137-1345(-)
MGEGKGTSFDGKVPIIEKTQSSPRRIACVARSVALLVVGALVGNLSLKWSQDSLDLLVAADYRPVINAGNPVIDASNHPRHPSETTATKTTTTTTTMTTTTPPPLESGDPRRYISQGIAFLSGGKALFGDAQLLPALLWKDLPQEFRRLPIVDVGSHDGIDFTIPGAKLGHRVYAFEPTPKKYANILNNINRVKTEEGANISHTDQAAGFRHAEPGSILLQQAVAVSEKPGFANFTVTDAQSGVGNSLSDKALPGWMRQRSTQVNVTLKALSNVLKNEDNGLFLLKIDSQGHEYQILKGAEKYIKTHPVYLILLEYFPKGIVGGGVMPIQLLKLLTEQLGYQCFDVRYPGEHPIKFENGKVRSRTIQEFADLTKNIDTPEKAARVHGYGFFTDLLCTRFDLL